MKNLESLNSFEILSKEKLKSISGGVYPGENGGYYRCNSGGSGGTYGATSEAELREVAEEHCGAGNVSYMILWDNPY